MRSRISTQSRQDFLQHYPIEAMEHYEIHSNLTQSQLYFWITQQIQPEIPLYNAAQLTTISGPLDITHFQKALQTLINCSDSLRLVFTEIDGVPQQKFLPYRKLVLDVIDLSSHPDPLAETLRITNVHVNTPFPLLHNCFENILFLLDQHTSVWYYCEQHILGDGWSRALLHRRLLELYDLSLRNQLHLRKPYPRFQDYLQFERDYYASPQYQKDRAYWQQKLTREIELGPFAHNNQLCTPSPQKILSRVLTEDQHQQIQNFLQQDQLTFFSKEMTLLAFYLTTTFTYLYQLTGITELAIATTFHHRFSPTFKETLGLLYKESVLSVQMSEEETFFSLLQKVMEEITTVSLHYHYSTFNLPPQKRYHAYFILQNSVYAQTHGFGDNPLTFDVLFTNYGHESLYIFLENFSPSVPPSLHFTFRADIFSPAEQQETIQTFISTLNNCLSNPDTLLKPAKAIK